MELEELLAAVEAGDVAVEEALSRIEGFRRVGDVARVDHDRRDRVGVPEAVLADAKDPDDLREIVAAQVAAEDHVVVTRVDAATRDAIEGVGDRQRWHDRAGVLVVEAADHEPPEERGRVAVVSGGTSDVPVAEEARVTAAEMGCATETHYDVGVAGIHRLLGDVDDIDACDAVVVAAGREGALPTVVAGLVDAPVIGLPVSVGYGVGGGGEAALQSMLQSCAVLTVVNVDAGFVAGAQAGQIARAAGDGDG